jgi:hypothetical protein
MKKKEKKPKPDTEGAQWTILQGLQINSKDKKLWKQALVILSFKVP